MLRVMACGLAALVLASAGAASAQPTARQLELAQRYVATMRPERMAGISDSMLSALMGPAKGADAEAKRARYLAVMRDVNAELLSEMAVRMTPILAETFTEKELEDVVVFYEGPSGRAIIEKTPELTARMTPLMLELIPKVQAKVIERLCEDGSCAPPPQTK